MSITLREAWCKVADWCENPPWLTAADLPDDLDEQNLTVDCEAGTLEISNGNTVPLADLGVFPIYRFAPTTPGLRARWWGPDAGPHLDPLEWAGPADPGIGFPLPTAAAPDFDVVNTATSISDSNSGADAARYGIISGWFWLPDNVTHVRDNNQNTGELGMVLLGGCCGGSLTEQPGGNHDTNTGAADRSLMDPTPIGGGWHYVYNPQSDLSAFQGLDLEYSTDGTASWSEVTVTQVDSPTVETVLHPACEAIPEGWQIQPLSECCQPSYTAGGGLDEEAVVALLPVASDATPIPDNELDTAIRTGTAGVSADFARADHNHPIVPQEHPAWPGVTVNANVTLDQETILDQNRSTEEWIEYEVRVRVAVDAGNNWPIITVPAIAGYRQPIITVTNTYRNVTNTYQEDDQQGNTTIDDGAAPVGPYMGIEWSHWSSTRGLYGPFRRENDITSWFVGFSAMYVRI